MPLALAALLWLVALPAAAQLEAGRRALTDADFERAERAFGRALGAAELSTEDLVSIFEGRAMARFALGDEAGASADLAALRSLDPTHALPPEAPPAMVEAFDALGNAGIGIELGWFGHDERHLLRPAVVNDPASLVHTVRVHLRRHGEPAWTTSEEREIEVTLRDGEAVEVWAEAIGPGGAVVAREGSPLAPREHGTEAGASLAAPDRAASDQGVWIGVGIGVGAAIVIGVVIAAVVVGTAQSDETQPAVPVVVGF
jgi:hypothetical protein